MADPVSITHDRFGLGARPGDDLPRDLRGYLQDQLRRHTPSPALLDDAPGLAQIGAHYQRMVDLRADARGQDMQSEEALVAARGMRREDHEMARQNGASRLAHAVQTATPFAERLVYFWSNHFAVSVDRMPMHSLAGDHEFRAIRPHIMGNFAELVKAAVLHPAMLAFLNQEQSIGPQSEFGIWAAPRRGRRGVGLNENLARELLELHTLGVRGGYTQTDVTELARALTGWTVAGFTRGAERRFYSGEAGMAVFAEALHEPGARTILDRRYPENGQSQALSIIEDLAIHPATARHVATKLARHFIADDPPEPAIARLEDAFLGSGGDLPAVYSALIEEPLVWAAERIKFRSPWDWLVASLRASDSQAIEGHRLVRLLTTLGQPLWSPGHPAGWSDRAGDWASPGALLSRVEIANRLAVGTGRRIDGEELASEILGDALRPSTRDALIASGRAGGTGGMGLALLLSSPEFLRR